MRKKEREITDRREIDSIIHNSLVCRIALCRDNMPYVIPVSFGYDGSSLFIHTAKEGLKIDFIESNPNVCFEFDQNAALIKNEKLACGWSFDYESVVGFGTISELIESKEKKYGLTVIMKQYSGRSWKFKQKSLDRTRVWKIEIDSVTGKKSSHKQG